MFSPRTLLVDCGADVAHLLSGVVRFQRHRPEYRLARLDVGGDWGRQVRDARADAVIARFNEDARRVEATRAAGVAAVDLHGRFPAGTLPTVTVDDRRVGEIAADDLLTAGYPRLAFIGVDARWSRERSDGCLGVAARRGVPCDLALNAARRTPTWDELADATLARRWLAKLTPPVGVLAANDDLAVLVRDAAIGLGIDIPNQLGLVGVDNRVHKCCFGSVPISSVDRNEPEVGYQAARLAHRLIEGDDPPGGPIVVEPLGVVARASTLGVPFDDPVLIEALTFMKRELEQNLGVNDIAAAAGVSRKTLERRFADALGRSPAAELRRLRLERVRVLLVTSDLPAIDVAVRCGFQSTSHLSKAFKQAFGESPMRFREMKREPR